MDFVRLQKEKITIHKGCTIGRFFFFFLFVFFFPRPWVGCIEDPPQSLEAEGCVFHFLGRT